MEATGHKAEAKLQKKTQQYRIHPTPARPRTRERRSVEQSHLPGAQNGADTQLEHFISEPQTLAESRIVNR